MHSPLLKLSAFICVYLPISAVNLSIQDLLNHLVPAQLTAVRFVRSADFSPQPEYK
jgi:hypothetical protein